MNSHNAVPGANLALALLFQHLVVKLLDADPLLDELNQRFGVCKLLNLNHNCLHTTPLSQSLAETVLLVQASWHAVVAVYSLAGADAAHSSGTDFLQG